MSTIEGRSSSRATQNTQPLISAADIVAELINQRCQTVGGTR
ncbi:hypothetical protein ACETU7_27005 [Rhodococcus sp. 3Y1]